MYFHRDLDPFYTRSENGPSNFHKHLEGQIESDDDALLVAEESGRIIGYAKIGILQYPPVFEVKKYGLISDVAVAEEYRRKGIGQALYNASTKWFTGKGVTRTELRVANVNNVARGFWSKMGFKPYMTTMFKEEN
jgi:ribosomal protein S18 acetylase RimI-like enzyme